MFEQDEMNLADTDKSLNLDDLVFPINVHESLRASSGLKRGEKLGIIISFWVFGCALLAWILAGWLRTIIPEMYLALTVLIEIVLQLTVGVYILRFAVDESTLADAGKRETSFAEFFSIYKEIESTEGSKYPFDVIEFNNGDYGVFIQCRLGHNTMYHSSSTYEVNKALSSLLNKSGMCSKVRYHNEQFRSSQAAKDLRATLSNIDDPKLFEAYRDMLQNYLNIAEEEGNVMAVTYIIYANTRIAKDDLTSRVTQFMNTIAKEDTVFREVSILSYEEIVEFLRVQYKLPVIDMGLVRTVVAQNKNKYNCPVHVIGLYGASGKVYKSNEFHKLNEEIISDSGLNPVYKPE